MYSLLFSKLNKYFNVLRFSCIIDINIHFDIYIRHIKHILFTGNYRVSVVPTLIFAVQKRMYVMKNQESVVYLTHMDLLTCPKKTLK